MERHIFLLGIGSTASKIVNTVARKIQQLNIEVTCSVMDTDQRNLDKLDSVCKVSLATQDCIGDVVSRLEEEFVSNLFPCKDNKAENGFINSLSCSNGAGCWRAKGLLLWEDFISDVDRRRALFDIIDDLLKSANHSELEIYIVSSLCGGTGSSLFVPVSSYIKQYIKTATSKDIKIKGFLLGSDIFESIVSAEQFVRINANAYATLRELNAFMQNKSSATFSKIYMFERHPSITNLTSYATYIAELIKIIIGNDDIKSREDGCINDSVFATAALSKVIYPFDSIVNHTARRFLTSKAFDEILLAYAQITEKSKKYENIDLIASVDEYLKSIFAYIDNLKVSSDWEFIGNIEKSIAVKGEIFKSLKKNKKKIFETVEKCREKFNTIFVEERDGFVAGKDAFLVNVDGVRNSISLIDGVIKQNGVFDSPICAFERLCTLSSKIKNICRDSKYSHFDDLGNLQLLPDDFFVICKSKAVLKGKYATASEERLLSLMNLDKRVLGNKEEDLFAFSNDLDEILKHLSDLVVCSYLKELKKSVDELIGKYIKFFDLLCLNKKDAEVDLSLSYFRNNEFNGNIQYICASPDDKDLFYQNCQKKIDGSIYPESLFDICYKEFAEYILFKKDSSVSVMDVFSDIVKQTGKRITEMFEDETINENIFDKLFRTVETTKTERYLQKAYHFANTFIKTDNEDDFENCMTRAYSAVLVSKGENNENIQEILYHYLLDIDVFVNAVEISTEVHENELFFYREISNIALSDIIFANEENVDSGFKNYNKAIAMMQKQYSPLWNPHVYCDMHEGGKLPYISAVAQKKWIKKSVKALTYAIVSGLLLFNENDTGFPKTYCLFEKEGKNPLFFNGENIEKEDYHNLCMALQAEVELIEKLSDMYDKCVQKELMNLPTLRYGLHALENVKKAINSCTFLQKIKKCMLMVAVRAGEYSEIFVEVCKNTIFDYCNARFEDDSDEFFIIYESEKKSVNNALEMLGYGC